MFTVCPKCSLKLVVTAADLRVAQGYVRCGRCANVFNALVGLSDEEQAVLSGEEHVPKEAPREREREPTEPAVIEPSGAPLPDSALEFDAAATDVSEVFVESQLDDVSATGQSENIILRSEDALEEPPEQAAQPADDEGDEGHEGDDIDAAAQIDDPHPIEKSLEETDEFELADLESLLGSSALRESANATEPAPPMTAQTASDASAPHSPQPQAPIDAPQEAIAASSGLEELEGLEPGAPRPRKQWMLGTGAALLTLLLAAQVVHHYRTRLAAVAWLRRPLTATYAALGMPLAPRWNVRAYEVRQLGAVVLPGSPGALTVRASIENTAAREQPLPLLRVTVQDRFGNRVAARDVRPQAYLPKSSARLGYLGAGERVDAEIAFVDPGPRVVGFEIDACLEDREGRVSCAHQPSGSR